MSTPPAPKTAADRVTLDDFALKGMHHAKMTGVMVAAHAISDAFLLMHTGVGCKYKTASQASQHDLAEHPNEREAWTQVSEAHLVAGCSDRIGPFARAWWERRPDTRLMVVVSAYFIELTGDDIPEVVRQVEATLPDCAMTYVATKAPNHGFFDGYAETLLSVLRRLPWDARPRQPRTAAVVGHFFHRFEPDAKGDVAALKALVKAAGLEPGPVLLSGSDLASCATAPDAGVQIVLPYVRPHEDAITALVGQGRRVVPLDLPIGLAGTRRFVRDLVGATGGDARKADAWAAAQADAVQRQIGRLTGMLNGTAWAVFAETPLAAGLTSLLHELGARVLLVGLRDKGGCLGGADEVRRVLRADGTCDPDAVEILTDPSLRATKSRCLALSDRGLTGVIGSTHEITALRHLPFEQGFSGLLLVETGFPADHHHVAVSLPTFGFTGVAAWAQRLVALVQEPRVDLADHLR